jgi:hypothetical protein
MDRYLLLAYTGAGEAGISVAGGLYHVIEIGAVAPPIRSGHELVKDPQYGRLVAESDALRTIQKGVGWTERLN